MPGLKVILQDLPIIKFVRLFQMVIRIVGETLVNYHIGKVEQWYQLFSDGTGRRNTDLHNLVIVVIDEERLRPLILSTYIILNEDMSEHQVDAVLSTIAGCRNWL